MAKDETETMEQFNFRAKLGGVTDQEMQGILEVSLLRLILGDATDEDKVLTRDQRKEAAKLSIPIIRLHHSFLILNRIAEILEQEEEREPGSIKLHPRLAQLFLGMLKSLETARPKLYREAQGLIELVVNKETPSND